MICIKSIPLSIFSWIMRHAETIVDTSLFLVTVAIWLSVLYYSTFNDETASVLSFIRVASVVFTTKRCFGGANNVSSMLPKIMGVEFLFIVLGCSLLAFTKFNTSAFYSICFGMLLQKIRYETRLAYEDTESPSNEVSEQEFPNENDEDMKVLMPSNLSISETAEGVKHLDNEEGFGRNADNQPGYKNVLTESDCEEGNEITHDIQHHVIENSNQNSAELSTELNESVEDVNIDSLMRVEEKGSIKRANEETNTFRRNGIEKQLFECALEPETIDQTAKNRLKLKQKHIEQFFMEDAFIESSKNKHSQHLSKCLHEETRNNINSGQSNKSQRDTNYDISVNKLDIDANKPRSSASEKNETNKANLLEKYSSDTYSPRDVENESKSAEGSASRNENASDSELEESNEKYCDELVLESKIAASYPQDAESGCKSMNESVSKSEFTAIQPPYPKSNCKCMDETASENEFIAFQPPYAESDCKSMRESALENEYTVIRPPSAENEDTSMKEIVLSNEMVPHRNSGVKEGQGTEMSALGNKTAASPSIDSGSDSESTEKLVSHSLPDTKIECKPPYEFAFENKISSSHSQASTNEGEVVDEFVSENGATASTGIANEFEHLPQNDTLAETDAAYYNISRRPASNDVLPSAYPYIQCRYLAGMHKRVSALSRNRRNDGEEEVSTTVQNASQSSRISDVENIVNRIDMSFIYSV